MSAHFDVEKDNARFFRISRRVITMFTVLTCIYLAASTYAILINNPSYMHDWRGVTCIVLTILAFLIYAVQFRMSLKMDWPPPWRYAVGLWASLYLVVLLLTLINNGFVWDFYVVFAIGFGLFGGVRLVLAVSCMASRCLLFRAC